jgi:hypothetical protein
VDSRGTHVSPLAHNFALTARLNRLVPDPRRLPLDLLRQHALRYVLPRCLGTSSDVITLKPSVVLSQYFFRCHLNLETHGFP